MTCDVNGEAGGGVSHPETISVQWTRTRTPVLWLPNLGCWVARSAALNNLDEKWRDCEGDEEVDRGAG